jgi:hypothetical protein
LRITLLVWVQEAEACGEQPGESCREDKPDAGHEDDCAEDEEAGVEVGETVTEGEEAYAEKGEDYAGLQGDEDAGEGYGDALVALEVDRNGCGLEETLAGFGVHVGEELLVAAEAFDEAAMDFALEFEDAGPSSVFKEGADEPEEDSCEAEKGEKAGASADELAGEFGHFAGRILLPHSALQAFAASPPAVREVGEEIEVGVAGDFGVGFEEPFELGIVAGNVILVGEEGGVVGDDLGEGGAHAEETHELGSGVGEVAFICDWAGCDGGRGPGWLK